MSEPSQVSGQSSSPSSSPRRQAGGPHTITTAGAARGTFTEDDATRLADSRGRLVNVTQLVQNTNMPLWSFPGWDGNFTTISDGRNFLQKPLRAGDFTKTLRPAVRLEDEARNPTEYARRFGLLPMVILRDAWGHSALTPTDPNFQTSAQRPEYDAYDESLQTLTFDYTSAELVAQGALNPRMPVSWPPDLDEPVDDLFARERWDQAAEGPPRGFWPGIWDVRYGPLLDGTEGQFNAYTNQAVWDAIEPALRLVSRVIKSNHPYWLAMTSIFHMRPVPDAKDGRTPEQRAEQGGTPYTSVWLEDDDTNPRIPAPYPEMAALKGLGFDSTVSRTVCLDILRHYLRFGIGDVEGSLGITSAWGDYNVVIIVNAAMVWPLLMTRHVSNSERASFTFALASCVLHELAHACANVHRDMTCKIALLRASSFAPRLNNAIWTSMVELGNQIYGPVINFPPSTSYNRPEPRQQMFAEDDVQGEEGINWEKQLWGGRVIPHHSYASLTFAMAPLICLAPWPHSHPQPLQQGRTEVDQLDRAYERFLTNPRAPSWNELLAIPVPWYARYFEKAWWETSFQKFKHHGLKLSTNDPALPVSLLRANNSNAVVDDDHDEMAVFFGAVEWEWLLRTVLLTLQQRDLFIMAIYLRALISNAGAARIFSIRFNNEILAWPDKYTLLDQAARGVSNDYQAMVGLIDLYMQPGADAFSPGAAAGRILEMNASIRRVLGPMLEFSRLMSQDVAYLQYILTQYFQLDAAVRVTFHANMQLLGTMTAGNLNILTGQVPSIPLQFATLSAETEGGWSNMLQQKLITDILNGDARSGNLPQDIEAQARVFYDLMGEITSLHRSFHTHVALLNEMNALIQGVAADGRAPDSSEWPRLRFFARVRSRRLMGAYQAAAIRELNDVDESALLNMWREALALLETKLDPAALDPARMALRSAEQRAATRQAELLRTWRMLLRNERGRRVARAQAREQNAVGVEPDPTPEEVLRKMRGVAGDVADDLRLLDSLYTVEEVRQALEPDQDKDIDAAA